MYGCMCVTVVPPPLFAYPDVGWPLLVASQTTAAPTLSDRMQALQHQTQPNLSAMGHFTSSALPGPRNVSTQFTAAVGWPLQGLSYVIIFVIIIIIIRYVCLLSQAFLPGTFLEPAVIPTAQASSFTLQYFPYYV